jgi:hypothetical protein
MNDLVKELEAFNNAHKARCVDINVGTGYGATCWEVNLGNEKKMIHAAECSFFECLEPDGHLDDIPFWNGKDGGIVVFACDPRKDDFYPYGGWPGLRPVLELALRTAKAMELPFRYEDELK